MKIMFRIITLLCLLVSLAAPLSAQTATTSTTLSSAVTATQTTVVVASATNVAAGSVLFIDREAMEVTSVSSTTATVQRGRQGTIQATHASGALVWVASSAQRGTVFTNAQKVGSCTASAEQFLPQINVQTGEVYYCTNSRWAASSYNPANVVVARTPITTTYTILNTDYLVVAAGTWVGDLSVTLPSPTGLQGKVIIVKDEVGIVAGTDTIGIVGTIDAGTSPTAIVTAYGVVRLYSNGSQWYTW